MKRSTQDYRLYLEDILDAATHIERFTAEIKSSSELKGNRLVSDAVLRNLEVIGEAVKNLPADVKRKREGVDWKGIAGLRDIITHGYFGVDYGIIWDIVCNKVPELKDVVEGLLEERG